MMTCSARIAPRANGNAGYRVEPEIFQSIIRNCPVPVVFYHSTTPATGRRLFNPTKKIIMKTTHWILITLLTGGVAIAEEAKPANERPQRPQRLIPAQILKEFDKDGDGKLSPEEAAAMRRVMRERRETRHKALIERFDADKDGELNEQERKVAHDIILREMLVKYDVNGNGELDPEEHKAMIDGEGHDPLRFFTRQRGFRGERGHRGPRPDGAERQPRKGTDAQRKGRQRPQAPVE